MGSYNRVLLMGNLTRDVEVRHTPNNQAVANIGLAVNRRYRTAEGEQREEVTFIDCEAWGATAETMSKYLAKGRPVFIEGRLKLDTWQDKTDGTNRSKLKVVVENFQFVDSKPGTDGGGGEGGGGGGYSRGAGGGGRGAGNAGGAGRAAPASAPMQTEIGEDDIPF